ncbi:MAG: DUF192 domain-containing protein [Candidatus Omnitrophota bacterium]
MSVNSKRLFLALMLAALCAQNSYAQDALRTAKVCVKGACVVAEIADTEAARMKGLMFRESLAETEGMLFVFPRAGRYGFWMMNMRIPLDIIWLDGTRRIVDIKTNANPCTEDPCESILPRSDALYVLEVPAGFTLSHQAAIGDTISITD